MLIIPAAVLVLLVLWICAVCPGRGRKAEMQIFSKQLIAHRGLHDNRGDAPENTLRAFSRAAEGGYGIELDVRKNRDGEIVVCHDEHLKRVAGVDRRVDELTMAELQAIPLMESDQHVPLFRDVLAMIDGRVPMIIEIKAEKYSEVDGLSRDVQAVIDEFPQTVYCIESFNPAVVHWYKKNRPEILRGQLSDRFENEPQPMPLRMLFSCCVFNFLTRPDFIAYNHRYAGLLRVRLIRRLFSPSFVAWTIKSRNDLEKAAEFFDVFIFDSFRPGAGEIPGSRMRAVKQ